MSHDITCPIETEHHALDLLHDALNANPSGLTIGKLAEATGYGRAYLERLLCAPYFKREGYKWKHEAASIDGALLANLAAQFSRTLIDR